MHLYDQTTVKVPHIGRVEEVEQGSGEPPISDGRQQQPDGGVVEEYPVLVLEAAVGRVQVQAEADSTRCCCSEQVLPVPQVEVVQAHTALRCYATAASELRERESWKRQSRKSPGERVGSRGKGASLPSNGQVEKCSDNSQTASNQQQQRRRRLRAAQTTLFLPCSLPMFEPDRSAS